VAVAAVRPGPMNNGLHLKYVKRKEGREKIDYHFGYKDYTEETYGIILFQEQVIRIASYLGNLNLVEGDGLRKALGKKKMSEMLKFHDKIKPHAIEKGCTDKEFEEIWDEWVEFAKYAFNKSHSVAYAITSNIFSFSSCVILFAGSGRLQIVLLSTYSLSLFFHLLNVLLEMLSSSHALHNLAPVSTASVINSTACLRSELLIILPLRPPKSHWLFF
jgi:hypothetical protein